MSEISETIFSINNLISSGNPFAIYRIPGEHQLHIIAQNNDQVFTSTNIEDLNGKKGFVIAPFLCKTESPLCVIRADYQASADITKNDATLSTQTNTFSVCATDYKIGRAHV